MRQAVIDIMGLLGLAALFYGLWQVYAPLAWIVGGLLLLGYALRASSPPPSAP